MSDAVPFNIEKINNYNMPVYKLSREKQLSGICIAFNTIESLLKFERLIARIITSKNAKKCFENYMKLMNGLKSEKSFQNLSDERTIDEKFLLETEVNFNDLIMYDVKQSKETIILKNIA